MNNKKPQYEVIANLRAQVDGLEAELQKRKEYYDELKGFAEEKDKEIVALKNEIEERDAIIETQEKRICALKRLLAYENAHTHYIRF